MANHLYDLSIAKMLNAVAISQNDAAQKASGDVVRLIADDIKAILVTAGYTFSQSHEFLASVDADTDLSLPAGDRSNASDPITGSAVTPDTDGVLFEADNTVIDIPVGATAYVAVVLFKDTGDVTTSPLIAFIDSGVTGLSPDVFGGVVTLQWGSGSGEVFRV